MRQSVNTTPNNVRDDATSDTKNDACICLPLIGQETAIQAATSAQIKKAAGIAVLYSAIRHFAARARWAVSTDRRLLSDRSVSALITDPRPPLGLACFRSLEKSG